MSQANLELARNAVAAFNRRDVPALVELTTDDFQWVTWTGTVEPTVYDGAEGLAAYFQDADVWEVHAPYYSAFFVSEGKLARVLSFRTEDEALAAVGLRG